MNNDRFKFRVWDALINEYRKEGTIQLSGNGQPFIIDGNMQPQDIDNVIIEQCTGLKDKNGKLIYENDIVQYNDQECGTVIFREGCWVWDWKVNDPPLYLLESYYFKIVGNIHEMESENE